MNIRYTPVPGCDEEWGNINAILKRYERLTRHTLNRWLGEMRPARNWREGVLNPTHKLVFINFERLMTSYTARHMAIQSFAENEGTGW